MLKRILIVAAALATALAMAVPAQAKAAKHVGFNSVPKNLPGNVSSQAFQATQASEFGDAIKFGATTSAKLKTVDVVMSSWGCGDSGAWYSNDCATTPGETFAEPITLNIHAVGPGLTLGSLIATKTQTFNVPYRPSADPVNCPATPGKWYDATDNTCYNGFATTIAFSFPKVAVPSQIVYGIAYNTSGYGSAPTGTPRPATRPLKGAATTR